MPRLLPSLVLLAAAGCQSVQVDPPAASQGPRYTATSHDPFWIAAVEYDRIVVTTGPEGGRADGELVTTPYAPLVLEADGWSAGTGEAAVSIRVFPGPCETGGRAYADRVALRLSGRDLGGCGGAAR